MMSAIAPGAVACASRSGGRYGRFLALSISAGATAFTRIPSGRSSRSSTRGRWTRVALLTAEAGIPAGRPPPEASGRPLPPPRSRAAPHHRDPGARQLPRRHTAELTPRAGHDRHTLAHAATPAETAPKTDDMAFILPIMNGPDRSGRVQAHHWEGERSSPDSSDPSAPHPKAHPGLHIIRTRSRSLTLTAAMALS